MPDRARNRDDSLLRYAATLQQAGRVEQAAAIYERLVQADSTNSQAMHLLGITRAMSGRFIEAEALIGAALEARPTDPAANYDLGKVRQELRKYPEALASYRRALVLKPDFAQAYNNCGNVLMALHRHVEALASFDQSVTLRPTDPRAHFSRGNALGALRRLDEALSAYEQALALDPTLLDAHCNRGNVLKELGRYDEALVSYDRALTLDRSDAATRWNKGMLKLLRGDMKGAWDLYEARFELDQHPRPCSAPQWSGSQSLVGKTILVHAEQGLGDSLQFCRYLPMVCRQAGRVVFEVPAAIQWLLSSLDCNAELTPAAESTLRYDYHCPLLSLPLAYGTDLASIPAEVPYLSVPPADVARWHQRLSEVAGLKIGIAWQGNPGPELTWARGRSAPLQSLRPLAEVPGVTLISLQRGHGLEQLPSADFAARVLRWDDFDAGLDAFRDTAALMQNLDLVITTDTAVAHLAGALGVPVWIALHSNPDWRWTLERTDSPWYPSARLFRQSAAGDWGGVFGSIAQALTEQRKW
jgi:tetratricopeptide (TPR) repeat protein